MIESLFRRYSQGIVAKDHVDGEMTIEAWPVEVILGVDGELDGETVDYKAGGIDSSGVEFSVQAKSSVSLTCEWIGETNRRTAPNVRRGESVTIWQYGEDDKFYWSSNGRTDSLRRSEHIIYSWSDVPEGDVDTPTTLENSHTLEIDTFNKFVEFKTVDADGEPFTYSLKFDLDAGNVSLIDSDTNRIILDSAKTLIHFENKEGTFAKLNVKDIQMYAPDSFYLEAVNTIDLKCTDFIMDASNSIAVTTKDTTFTSSDTIAISTTDMTIDASSSLSISTTDFSCSASASVTIETAAYTLNGSSVDITAGAINLTGAIGLNGPVALAGALTCAPGAGGAGGGASIAGGLEVSDGGLKVTGGLTVDTITFTAGISGPNGSWHMP